MDVDKLPLNYIGIVSKGIHTTVLSLKLGVTQLDERNLFSVPYCELPKL